MRATAPRRVPAALAVLGVVATLLALPSPAAAEPARVSSHAMLFTCCMPYAQKERIFAESKAMGARYLRVDVQLSAMFEFFGGPVSHPNWKQLDEVIELSRRYDLPVFGILMAPPAYVTTCPERWPDHTRCAVRDEAEFSRLVGEVAARAGGAIDHWEIVNEPDGGWTYEGTAEQYARMLNAAHRGIEAGAPEAKVVLGGLMSPNRPAWLERVFATPGAAAAASFDVANLHLRGNAAAAPVELAHWRALLRSHGFNGPVWVTEHGYPADPAYQYDPTYQGGEAAQAAYLTESVLGLADAGADQVFVTLRDALDGGWASEGLVHIEETAGYPARRKPAFAAVRRLVDQWDQLRAWRAEAAREKLLAQLSATRAGSADRRALLTKRRLRNARRATTSLRRLARRLRRARPPGRARASHRVQVSRRARLTRRRAAAARRAVARVSRLRHTLTDNKQSARRHRLAQLQHSLTAHDLTERVAGRR